MVTGGSEAAVIAGMGGLTPCMPYLQKWWPKQLQDLWIKTEMVLFRRGAGALVLEEYEHAVAWSKNILK
jgi:hypothetical protein